MNTIKVSSYLFTHMQRGCGILLAAMLRVCNRLYRIETLEPIAIIHYLILFLLYNLRVCINITDIAYIFAWFCGHW